MFFKLNIVSESYKTPSEHHSQGKLTLKYWIRTEVTESDKHISFYYYYYTMFGP